MKSIDVNYFMQSVKHCIQQTTSKMSIVEKISHDDDIFRKKNNTQDSLTVTGS